MPGALWLSCPAVLAALCRFAAAVRACGLPHSRACRSLPLSELQLLYGQRPAPPPRRPDCGQSIIADRCDNRLAAALLQSRTSAGAREELYLLSAQWPLWGRACVRGMWHKPSSSVSSRTISMGPRMVRSLELVQEYTFRHLCASTKKTATDGAA